MDNKDLDHSVIPEKYFQQIHPSNLNTLIFRLPHEVMVEIFGYCLPSRNPDIQNQKTRWLAFSHVCRLWRSIALDNGTLWTNIDLSYPSFAEMMLERSKAAMLDIQAPWLCSNQPAVKRVWGKVQCQLVRIRHMHLWIPVTEMALEFLDQLLQPAPCLRSLEITSHDLTLPEGFLCHTAPSLTHLRLNSVWLPWNSPLLSNLTSLELRGNCHTNIPTAMQLQGVLRALPYLEILLLEYILPQYMDRAGDIHLSHLRKLTISGNIAECDSLLKNISFPETTVLSIDCSLEIEDIDPFHSFISHFPRIFLVNHSPSPESQGRRDRPRIMKTLFIDLQRESYPSPCVVLTAWNDGITIPLEAFNSYESWYEIERRLPSPCLQMSFMWDPDQDLSDLNEDREAIFNSLPMQTVETLHIRGPKRFHGDDDDTDSLFCYFKPLAFNSSNVNTIVLVRSSEFEWKFAQFLALLRNVDRTVTPPALTFPALRTLAPICCYTTSWSSHYPGHPSVVEQLLEVLLVRSQIGKAVKTIAAEMCIFLHSNEATWLEAALPVEELRWIDVRERYSGI